MGRQLSPRPKEDLQPDRVHIQNEELQRHLHPILQQPGLPGEEAGISKVTTVYFQYFHSALFYFSPLIS